ncbi:MAG TPA: TM0106 family RecB-like putative nuclease [Beutenbergiaceae bacterium]|nr:TM0106 family RecB-like putative nuclease [Beutenbergiaceae bacterium]
MRLLDDHVVLTPNDLSQCEFALVREIAELRGLLPATPEREFMAERVAALTAAQRERVSKEYRRRYSRMFVHLDPPRGESVAELRAHHDRTLDELRSLRAVAGGSVLVDVEPAVLLHAAPTVSLLGSVADTVLERFARAGDVARLGGHAHALHAATGRPVTQAYLHLNNDRRQEYAALDLQAVIRPRLTWLASLAARALAAVEPWSWGDPEISACGFCARCRAAAEEHRDVQLVWGMRRGSREALRRAGITTIDELAQTSSAPEGLDAFSWARFRDRAELQLRPERTDPPAGPFSAVHDPATLAALPDPNPGDIFFDFEGDPFWVEKNRFEWGLEFLFGYIEADTDEYVAIWAANQAEEKVAFTQFLDYLAERRAAYPGMHVYHFAFYEQATLRRLARRHRTGQKEVNELLDAGVFVDLYETVKAGVHVSSRSYGLKALEPLYMGEDLRTSDVTDGGAAVVAYEDAVRARKRGDEETWRSTLADLAEYNRYDCESTRRLRDWLLEQRAPHQLGEDGAAVAQELLGATSLDSELLLSPLNEESEDLSFIELDVPGFDEPGIFYVSSGNSIDAIGAEHKLHELLGRWGSGSEFSPGADVLVVYADPDQGPTSSEGLVARRAEILECEHLGADQRLSLREATPAHDPETHRLAPAFLRALPGSSAVADPSAALKQAKRLAYSIITGPAGAGKTALAAERAEQDPNTVVIDDAHQVSVLEALRIAGDAEHVLVVGDPARATPIARRALPSDLVGGPLLSWLQGESGATIRESTALTATERFHPALAAELKNYLYPDVETTEPSGDELRLLPDEHTGVQVRTVSHRGNRDSAAEEASAIAELLTTLFAVSPLAESDVLVTAVYDSQALLLQRELAQWSGVRIMPLRLIAGEEAAVSIVSLASSSLTDAPFGKGPTAPRAPLAPHVLGAALTRARESAFIVCSEHLLEQLPPRAAMFTDTARFAELLLGELHS